MNKTTYANFHCVVTVFLGGGCVQCFKCVWDGNVHRCQPATGPLFHKSLFFHNYIA